MGKAPLRTWASRRRQRRRTPHWMCTHLPPCRKTGPGGGGKGSCGRQATVACQRKHVELLQQCCGWQAADGVCEHERCTTWERSNTPKEQHTLPANVHHGPRQSSPHPHKPDRIRMCGWKRAKPQRAYGIFALVLTTTTTTLPSRRRTHRFHGLDFCCTCSH